MWVRMTCPDLGGITVNTDNVVAVIPAIDNGRPVIGCAVIVFAVKPNLTVKGSVSSIHSIFLGKSEEFTGEPVG